MAKINIFFFCKKNKFMKFMNIFIKWTKLYYKNRWQTELNQVLVTHYRLVYKNIGFKYDIEVFIKTS